MSKTTNYDFNIWSDGKKLYLTAYELRWDTKEQALYANVEKYLTIGWKFDQENQSVIDYLLEDVSWENEDYTDHDDWVGYDDIITGNTPPEIKAWVENLPEYKIKEN